MGTYAKFHAACRFHTDSMQVPMQNSVQSLCAIPYRMLCGIHAESLQNSRKIPCCMQKLKNKTMQNQHIIQCRIHAEFYAERYAEYMWNTRGIYAEFHAACRLYSHWGHLVQTPQISSRFKDKKFPRACSLLGVLFHTGFE